MIVSISRRTDIAAFYTPWLMERLRAGEVLVPRAHQPGVLERVDLSGEAVDCLVVISKDPAPLLLHLAELKERGLRLAVQMTITGYGPRWEPYVPPAEQSLAVFERLSQALGAEWIDWRYDPILLGDGITERWHHEQFAKLCAKLAGLTTRCIVSFVDDYPHLGGVVQPLSEEIMRALAGDLAETAARYGLTITSCAEAVDLSAQGVQPSACIDGERLSRLLGWQIPAGRAQGQRKACRCAESIDIGSYDTCLHGCRYCYATTSTALAKERYRLHDPHSPLLWGWPTGREQIVERKLVAGHRQLKLF